MKILRFASAAAALATAIVGTGLTYCATPAAADVPASQPITYVTQSFWSASSSVPVFGSAQCPSGSRVVSSGASAPGGQLVGLAPDINFFDRATASARVHGYLNVTVGCEPFAAISEVTTRVVGFPQGTGFRRGVAYCPAGMRAFGGGGYMRKYNGGLSTDTYRMVSNAVSADGTGWTFAATTTAAKESLVITTQCAPLRSSYVSQNSTPAPPNMRVNVYGPCNPGYIALSGGVYLSKQDGNEGNGSIDYSVPASGNHWYTDGVSTDSAGSGDKLVSPVQCIL
ncbi:hypothetical protein [Streptomyces sp. NBC_01465]|uniref:hypothetical protein n=1 Tax=Streptomyces sp. NBC_01465 TaxID=2903878 RepID=UPI002E309F1A|nr:hypothetical protein [Streptomyces sp. NBC_01465]